MRGHQLVSIQIYHKLSQITIKYPLLPRAEMYICVLLGTWELTVILTSTTVLNSHVLMVGHVSIWLASLSAHAHQGPLVISVISIIMTVSKEPVITGAHVQIK